MARPSPHSAWCRMPLSPRRWHSASLFGHFELDLVAGERLSAQGQHENGAPKGGFTPLGPLGDTFYVALKALYRSSWLRQLHDPRWDA